MHQQDMETKEKKNDTFRMHYVRVKGQKLKLIRIFKSWNYSKLKKNTTFSLSEHYL